MRILCIATKAPWPSRDGGRLALATTIAALADAGHRITVLAPADERRETTVVDAPSGATRSVELQTCPCPKRAWAIAAASAIRHRTSLSVARHHHAATTRLVAQRIADERPDVVHVEQLQALAHAEPAFALKIPVVLRMQNVESSLLEQAAAFARSARWPLRIEAVRVRRDEREAISRVARVIALTAADARALAAIAHGRNDHIVAIPPPFSSRLAAGPALEGPIAVVIAGSAWRHNAQATRWFIREVMPGLRSASPRPHVHVFGGEEIADESMLTWHPAPDDSTIAFPARAIVAVPLLTGSGIRMRILEAWSRGCPVVATGVAAAGLDVASGRELLIADAPDDFAAAILRLATDGALRESMIDGGRRYLERHHRPDTIAAALTAVYSSAAARDLSVS